MFLEVLLIISNCVPDFKFLRFRFLFIIFEDSIKDTNELHWLAEKKNKRK